LTIKGLTVSQPWASKIGEKWVENRGWFTKYRGWLGLHAGKGTQYMPLEAMRAAGLPVGCFVSVARLRACVEIGVVRENAARPAVAKSFVPGTSRTWGEVARHEFTEGPWCWILSDVFKLPEPIACNGAQGLWTIPDDVVAKLRAQHQREDAR
jgi:hypothetical protein